MELIDFSTSKQTLVWGRFNYFHLFALTSTAVVKNPSEPRAQLLNRSLGTR